MSKNTLIAVIVICVTVFLSVVVYTFGHRYSVVTVNGPDSALGMSAYRIDHLTGEVHFIHGAEHVGEINFDARTP